MSEPRPRFLEAEFEPRETEGWRARWHDIVFRHDTPRSRNFDVLLIVAILASVLVVILDSVGEMHARWAETFYAVEWAFTLIFTAEYILRMALVRRPMRYATSFFGVIDLVSILPTYLSLLFAGSQFLMIVRVLRVLRIFRVLKLAQYSSEAGVLIGSLARSRHKILVFLYAILTIVAIFGAVMYLVEGADAGFTSIPMGMYWAIVTVSTVGYGDITPLTSVGKFIASMLVLIGYSVIAVPTGIYTAELARQIRPQRRHVRCVECGLPDHENDAWHCRKCGRTLPDADATATARAGDADRGGDDG